MTKKLKWTKGIEMGVEITKNGNMSSVSIDGEMTVCSAARIKKEIFEDVVWDKAVSFDLSGVSEMDTAGFQLLMLAKKEAALKNCIFSVKAHSMATSAVIELFNMKEHLEAGPR